MEEVTKEHYEMILNRLKRCLTKVETGTKKTIEDHDEDYHGVLYERSLAYLKFLLAASFGDDLEALSAENLLSLEDPFVGID